MKNLILLTLLIGSLTAYCQDTTKTRYGYDIWYDSLFVRIDTVHLVSQVFNYYDGSIYVQVDSFDTKLIPKNQVFTVWSNHFTVTVTRKRYRRIYQF